MYNWNQATVVSNPIRKFPVRIRKSSITSYYFVMKSFSRFLMSISSWFKLDANITLPPGIITNFVCKRFDRKSGNRMKCLLGFDEYLRIVSSKPSRHLLVLSQKWKHQNNLWKLFKVNERKRNQNDANDVFLVSLLLTLNRFHTLFCVNCWLRKKNTG